MRNIVLGELAETGGAGDSQMSQVREGLLGESVLRGQLFLQVADGTREGGDAYIEVIRNSALANGAVTDLADRSLVQAVVVSLEL